MEVPSTPTLLLELPQTPAYTSPDGFTIFVGKSAPHNDFVTFELGEKVDTWLHARGINQKPGGWRNFRYNMEMGPPLMAPLLVTLVGGMGLLAAVLRRESSAT